MAQNITRICKGKDCVCAEINC